MSEYITLNTAIEFLCFAAALFWVGWDRALAWRSMVVFTMITCIGELTGIYISLHTAGGNNHWLYNCLLPFQIVFTHILYFHLLRPYKWYWLMLSVGMVILSINLGGDLLDTGIFKFSMHTYAMLAVFNIVYGLTYYFLKLKDDEHYENLLNSAGFWWVAGNLFFSFGSTISNLFDDQLYSVKWHGHHLTFYIFRGLNLIFYSSWIYAFYCRKWKNQE